MISQIALYNFKCFEGGHEFPLSKFNLLTGINGRGKSSLLQSLLLMKQTTEYDSSSNCLILNGSCVQLGSFEDIKNSFAPNKSEDGLNNEFLAFRFEFINTFDFQQDSISKTAIDYVFVKDDDDDSLATIRVCTFDKENGSNGINDFATKTDKSIDNNENQDCREYVDGRYFKRNKDEKIVFNDFMFKNTMFNSLIPTKISVNTGDYNFSIFKRIQFISADRIGPKNYYEIQNVNKNFSWVGSKGENTASILWKKKGNHVHEELYLGADANTLLQQTEEWLNFIFDGAKININTEGGVVLISYNTKQGRERYKPSNVGFGYSYILPIVVAGLIANSGEILVIENPEAHLHPRAQHKLTQFLAKVAATGVQIFVESHSEHILNALRICTIEQEGQEKILDNTDLSILYFQDNLTTPFIHIPIDEKGGIDEWPEGFFDQTDKDFKILFGF
jgi:predicted ATPase